MFINLLVENNVHNTIQPYFGNAQYKNYLIQHYAK